MEISASNFCSKIQTLYTYTHIYSSTTAPTGETWSRSLLHSSQSFPSFREIPVQAWNLNQAMEGFSIKGFPSCREMLCLLLAVRFTASLWSHIPCLARDKSLTKTTTKCLYLRNQFFFLASSNYESICIKLSFKSKSCIVINNAKGSFFFKGRGKLLLINAKGQFSQTQTNSSHFLTHPALNSDRSYAHIKSTLRQQGIAIEILPV